MADSAYTNFKRGLLEGEFDLNATDDIRIALLMTNTTADTEEDVATISAFTTLDEMDGANYSRAALASEAVAADNANDRGEFDADNVTFSSLGAGTRDIAGILLYKHVTDDTDSVPMAWIDSGGFPITANGGDLTISWNAEGILQTT